MPKGFVMKKVVLVRRNTIFAISIAAVLTTAMWIFGSGTAGTLIKKVWPTDSLVEIEVYSPDYPYFIFAAEEQKLDEVRRERFTYNEISPVLEVPPLKYYSFTFCYEDGKQRAVCYSKTAGIFYEPETMRKIKPSQGFLAVLSDLTTQYENKAYLTYGALIPWEETDEIFELFSEARVTDLRTGKSFNVQRRAGSSHADVQPLTAEDTAVMKKIYNGRWSWNRRAVIVEVGGYRIAASMNGMPHGAGKIPDNNFPGHFCIHFLASTTHSGNMDILHQKETLRAAGKLPCIKESE